MNKIKKIGIVAVLALALTLSSAAPAIAGLTLGATTIASSTTLTIDGAAGSALTIGDASQTAAISIGTSDATLAGLNLANGTGAATVNIATNNTAADDINIGSAGDDVDVAGEDIALTSADDIQLVSTSTDGIINIGATTAVTHVINVGTVDAVQTIHIGDNASPANVITIGGAASSTTVKGTLTVGVDGTGHDVQLFGATASSHLLWDESDDALELNGEARLDLSGATVTAANTDGGVIKAGTSGSPITEDTADMKFMSFYFDNGATSGDNRGIYNRLSLTGAGGGGESLRSYTEIVGVAAGTAHGAHISLGMGESTTKGAVTGLGVGVRSTLGLPDGTLASGGTYAAMMPEIYSFGAGGLGDVSNVTELSFIRPVNGGHATGRASVDDKAFLLALDTGFTDGTGNMLYDPTLKIKAGANTRYLIMSEAEGKLDLGDSSQGIDIGNATTGIALTGTQTTGIDITGTISGAAIDISDATVSAAAGPLLLAGSSASPVTTSTADTKFVQLYTKNTSNTGDNRGIYNRLALTGTAGTGGGESLRSYTDLDTGTVATAHGAHISLGMGEGDSTKGAVTGLGVGVRATLGLPGTALASGGTYAAMQPEIYSFGTASDAGAVTELSFIRAVNGGSTTGKNNVDDDASLFSLQGFTADTGSMIEEGTGMGTVTGTIKIKIGGTTYYLPYYSTPG